MALWTPQLIPTALWLDAADSDTITIDTGVSQWDDKSGNDRHATALNNKASILAGAVNGKDVISIPASNAALGFPGTVLKSVFMVFRWRTPNGNFEHLFGDSHQFHGASSSTGTGPVFGDLGALEGYNAAVMVNGASIGTGANLNKSPNHRLVNLSFVSATSSLTSISTADPYFPSRTASIDVCEFVAFADDLSTDDRQKIEGYLAWKWGLEENLPSGHPYEDAAPAPPASISGIIRDRFGNPCQRKVYAISRPTDNTAPVVLAHNLSDPVTGAYELVFSTTDEVTRVVVSEDDANPLLNDIIDRVIPA